MSKPPRNAATEFIDHGSESYTFLQDPLVDALMQVVVELGMETWTTRRRLLVLERVLADRDILPIEATETYSPSEADRAEWRMERDRLVKTVYSALARRPDGGDSAAERAKTPAAPKRPPRNAGDSQTRVTAKGPSGV